MAAIVVDRSKNGLEIGTLNALQHKSVVTCFVLENENQMKIREGLNSMILGVVLRIDSYLSKRKRLVQHHKSTVVESELIDNHLIDNVVKLKGFPQSSIGAPCPALVSTEHSLLLCFYLENRESDWDGTTVKTVGYDSQDECVCVVNFERPTIHTFGPPNDEAFAGHRLEKKGVTPYSAFEIINSSWIQQLEIMNSVHPYHDRGQFLKDKRHFIISFHDSAFECIANGYEFKVKSGSISGTLEAHVNELFNKTN